LGCEFPTVVVTEKGGALSLGVTNPLYERFPSTGGGDVGVAFYWFAIQTKPRHEKKVNAELREKGIDSFLALHRERRRWSDRYSWVELPLFSQYLFVRLPISTEFRARVLQTTGVVQFVGAPGRGTAIPDDQIENLQTIVAKRIPITPREFLRVGKRVRVRGGALEGLEGILSEIRNDKSLVVSIDLIQKSVAIRLDGFEVEPA
jgi:transcription antitermination factor NusG